MPKTKSIQDLLTEVNYLEMHGYKPVKVTGIIDDSRKVKKGILFVAINGINQDSHKFIPEAIKQGALVVVGERKPMQSWIKDVTYIKVNDSREALSKLVSAWFGYPSKKLKVIGVTGTDGKTTTVNIIFHILRSIGKKAGMINTVDTRINKKIFETGLHVSNPEPLQLQEYLKKMVNAGCEYVVLEVTSHGLDQNRTAGIDFDISVLTNISSEHLDYHKNMNNYTNTKVKLLNNSKIAITNTNDSNSEKASKLIDENVEKKQFSFSALSHTLKKTVKKRYREKYNIENASAAVYVAILLGINENDIAKAIQTFRGVEGRLQKVKNNKSVDIIIDFAHTPASVEKVLTAVKKQTRGKLISIVSAEGERDPNKREMIAKVSCNIADITILNPIDPRGEDPDEILNAMINGAANTKAIPLATNYKKGNKYYKGEIDRKKAIDLAINKLAEKGDTVIICGKGHEKSMAVKGKELPWSDLLTVKSILPSL